MNGYDPATMDISGNTATDAGDYTVRVTSKTGKWADGSTDAVTAAWSLGVGSCYIGDVMERCEEHRALLGLPDYVFPAAMVVFGYPTAGQKARKKPERCAMERIVRENRYRRMGADELREMLAPKSGADGYEAWLAAFCGRKYNSAFSREMTRSVEAYLAAFRREEP